MGERKPEWIEVRFPGAARVLRLTAAAVLSLWLGGFMSFMVLGEAMATSRAGTPTWELFATLALLALAPLCFGAVTVEAAKPHSPAVPATITTIANVLLGLGAFADGAGLVYLLMAAPPYLLGVWVHSRHVARRRLVQRYAAKSRSRSGTPAVP